MVIYTYMWYGLWKLRVFFRPKRIFYGFRKANSIHWWVKLRFVQGQYNPPTNENYMLFWTRRKFCWVWKRFLANLCNLSLQPRRITHVYEYMTIITYKTSHMKSKTHVKSCHISKIASQNLEPFLLCFQHILSLIIFKMSVSIFCYFCQGYNPGAVLDTIKQKSYVFCEFLSAKNLQSKKLQLYGLVRLNSEISRKKTKFF